MIDVPRDRRGKNEELTTTSGESGQESRGVLPVVGVTVPIGSDTVVSAAEDDRDATKS